MSVVKGVVGSVNAILKTLECAVCLELLKTPVTIGCGHFFCKFCITEVLKSNYRSPCPLCKKPFTRRSIQEAQQRQSVIQAAKELAEACGIFTGVSFFSKEISDGEVTNISKSSLSDSRKSTSVQESVRSSSSKKRKSHESETSGANLNDTLSADKAKDKCRKSVETAVKDPVSVSINDEIIPSTNKRHCQSYADSDDDLFNFPTLEEILQSKSSPNEKRKTDDMEGSKNNSKEIPVVLLHRATDSEINSECNIGKINEREISVIPDTNAPISVTVNNIPSESGIEKMDADIPIANENRKGKAKRKIHLNYTGSRFRSRLSNKNNALTNKTNQLNLKKQEAMDKSLENKTKNAEKVDVYEFNNEQLVKENKEVDVVLFLSPAKSVSKRDHAELSLSPSTSKGRRMSRKSLSRLPNKNEKNTAQTSSSSVEEENILISNLNEAENFQLEISNCASKSSSIDVSSDSNEKECYNLKEINLPPINKTSETELATETSKELLDSDKITDTAVSVQTVASPEAAKIGLLIKSPGWSKVKQVGKDFRIRKFSKLLVEKNASNSCPSEVVAMDICTFPSEPLTEQVYDKKLMKIYDPVSRDNEKNNSCNKERMKFKELTSITENKNVKNAVVSPVESKSGSNISESNDIVIEGIDHKDCRNDEISEIPTLIDETENNAIQIDIDLDDQETRFPSPLYDDIPCGKDNKTRKFPTACIKELPLPHFACAEIISAENAESAENINSVENEIVSSVISNSSKNITNMPISVNKNLSLANTPLTRHVQTDVKECNDNYNFVNVSKIIQTSVFSTGTNCDGASMEVDCIENVGINSVVNSHLQSIGISHPKSNYSNHNYLTGKSSGKQNSGNIIDTPRLVKEKESLFKYDALETALDQDKNVYYAEHSQQTSQRLLEFCDNNRQPKALFAPVSLHPAVMTPNAMLKRNDTYEKNDSPFNQVERFNANMFTPTSTERTKVIKRTCLTLDEIQEAFAKSSASGNTETICSLPFLSGDFRLNVCVSEETLNISVLKVVGSDSFLALPNKGKTVLLSEKNIQTSNSNTPVHSPTAILPSSNVESESSQPENQQKGGAYVKTTNPFPFLSEYFSDSESTAQVGAKEPTLDDSEIFPFVAPVINASEATKNVKQNEEMVCEDVADGSVLPQVCASVYDSDDALSDLPVTQPYTGNVSSYCNIPDGNDVILCEGATVKEPVSLNKDKIPFADRSLEKSSKSQNFSKNDSKSKKLIREKSMSPNVEKLTVSNISSSTIENNSCEKVSLFKSATTANKCPNKENVKSPNYSDSKNSVKEKSLQIASEKSCNSTACPPVGNIFSENISASSKSYQEIFDDSDDFSSDPDMAFAMELVAPLKNIAEKMKSSENKEKSFQHGFPYSSKEKNPIETFEELILSKHRDSFQNSSVSQKPSRLSLKSKRSSKKFKRIKTCESDDDSDVSESSKNESTLGNISRKKNIKGTVNDKPQKMTKTENLKNSSPKNDGKAASPNDQKSQDMASMSLQDNSTFNSCVSEDMTNNSSDIAMEIEDIDEKILSVVEKLKQCGHEDVLKQEKQKQTLERDLSKLLDKDCQSSCDSEDSTDIFSQSVPPTPPDATSNNNDSFKALMYSKK